MPYIYAHICMYFFFILVSKTLREENCYLLTPADGWMHFGSPASVISG